jgi:hypothetical protein
MAKHTFTTVAIASLLALGACVAPAPPPQYAVGPKVKECPMNGVELEHYDSFFGPIVFNGPLTAEAQEARQARAIAEQSPTIPCPVFADRPRETTTTVIESVPSPPPVCSWAGGAGGCI